MPGCGPGMTAVARIATERVPDVVLVPVESIFQRDGAPVVYTLSGSKFLETPVDMSASADVSRRLSTTGPHPAIGLRPAVRPRA